MRAKLIALVLLVASVGVAQLANSSNTSNVPAGIVSACGDGTVYTYVSASSRFECLAASNTPNVVLGASEITTVGALTKGASAGTVTDSTFKIDTTGGVAGLTVPTTSGIAFAKRADGTPGDVVGTMYQMGGTFNGVADDVLYFAAFNKRIGDNARLDTSKSQWGCQIESNFKASAIATDRLAEYSCDYLSEDGGTALRPFGMAINHITLFTGVTINADQFTVANGAARYILESTYISDVVLLKLRAGATQAANDLINIMSADNGTKLLQVLSTGGITSKGAASFDGTAAFGSTTITGSLSASTTLCVGCTSTDDAQKVMISGGDAAGLRIKSTGSPVLSLYSTVNQANSRNYRFISNYNSWGMLELARSVDKDTAPSVTVLSFDAEHSDAAKFAGTVRAAGYLSSDGTAGATVTTCTGFKNGLCISGT
jgi:hypothetical protein